MTNQPPKCAVCILAGGLSKRMGRSKAGLRFGSKTLLGHIRTEARRLGLPMRVIRRDLVPRCGPLGGIYTALKTSATEAELFMACDMPFVSSGLMERMILAWQRRPQSAFFAGNSGGASGFPLLLPVRLLPLVERQVFKGEFSIQALAKAVKALVLRPPRGQEWQLFNVNTPEDWRVARQRQAGPPPPLN